jgi:hypothetical protein
LSTGDKIALISLIFTVITTVCVLFLTYAALAQTARPNITVRLLSPYYQQCGTESTYIFEFVNIGHWYSSPIAVDLTAYCNFPSEFELLELRYGSVQENLNTEVKAGVGGVQYLKAKGLILSRHEKGEQVHLRAIAPKRPGNYRVRVTAYSSNDASLSVEFELSCGFPVVAADS